MMRSYFRIVEQLLECGSYEDLEVYCINVDIIEPDCEGSLTYDSNRDIWLCCICNQEFSTSEIVQWIAEQEMELYL